MANEGTNDVEDDDDDTTAAEKVHKQYLKERESLVDAARESIRTFDKAVLTFGAAVFGFSIAFLKDVAPHPMRATLTWLGIAWGLFAFGLLFILLSFLFSHRACLFAIECADSKIDNPNSETKENTWGTLTHRCNYACIGCLFLGLLAWSVFAFKNLGQEGNEAVNKVSNPTQEKGYVPPPPPAKPPAQQPAAPVAPPADKK